MIDLIVTNKDRLDLLSTSLESLVKNTDPSLYRLTMVTDGSKIDHRELILAFPQINHIIHHRDNEGLGPSINQALAHVNTINQWFDHPICIGKGEPSKFICYLQDDLLYSPKWLETLVSRFQVLEKSHNLFFASGLECVEHQEDSYEILGNPRMIVKRYIRAACMLARSETFMSMFPIPPLDPETGRFRAKPNDGMGSGVDWHFMRNHPNSVERTGKKCLVIPGLVKHLGYDRSTWLKRDLPESKSDLIEIEKHIPKNSAALDF